MNGVSGFSSRMRFTGLSGFDTESIVTQLMQAERIPLDALKQKRTLLEWKQESYREVISSIKGFETKFFDIVNRSSYLLSPNSIKTMTAKSSNSDYITATPSSGVSKGTHKVKVLQLATAGTTTSSGKISRDVTGTVTDKALAGKKILVTLDGITKEITLENYTNDNLESKLQDSLDSAFGESKVQVSFDTGAQKLTISTIGGATKVTVYGSSETPEGLDGLGIASGASNRISLNSSLLSLRYMLGEELKFSAGGTLDFNVNGKTISANATDTLGQLFEKINNTTGINAKISYDEITDKVTIASTQTGAGDTLNLTTLTGNFFEAFQLGTITEGQDAKISINGAPALVRSTNNFNVNGITYNLNKVHEESSTGDTITIEQDTDTVIKNIKSFVEEYNKLIDNINGRVKESYDRDYIPLTDAQKEDMNEDDIENWEKKAKIGLLKNDSILQRITLSMRKALYEKVDGVNLTLKDIGIESRSYSDNGKLYFDEDKLKEALVNKPDEVTKLLNGVSAENPSYTRNLTIAQKQDRYNKSGVFQRLSDIIKDNITTSRDSNDRKGILLEKAGIENDLSNTENLMSEELDRYDDRIDDLIDKLTRKEEDYYLKFSNLENYLNQMNQQSAWITSQFSSGQ